MKDKKEVHEKRDNFSCTLLFICLFRRRFLRQLCQDDSREHDDASKKLFCGKLLSKDDPACKYGDTGFQGKNQRSYRWIDIFLAYDLQSVGNAAGHNAGIQDGEPCSEDRRNLRMFQDKSQDHGQDPADQELDTGKFYSVCFRGKIVNDQNVQRKQERTHQHQDVSETNGKTVRDAEKIKSDQCHDNSCPDKGTAFLFQKESDNRDNDNIAGCDEAGFSYRCIFDAELLEVAGCKESNSAGDSSDPEIAGFVWRRCGC